MSRGLLLDANALIALSDPAHPIFQFTEETLRAGGVASTCAIAWHEYVRGPLLDVDKERALRVIESRIVPLRRKDSEVAARLFNATGRRRGSTADCLIAAVAITEGLELVTRNIADFSGFGQFGLRMAEVPFQANRVNP